MQLIETSHLPSADDISLDSLEYFFEAAPPIRTNSVPWVDIAVDLKPPKKVAELQVHIELLEKQFQDNAKQLQRANILIGYMQGLVDERDEQLKVLPELRFKAGESVALRLEIGRAKEKIRELETCLARLEISQAAKPNNNLKDIFSQFFTEDRAIEILSWVGVSSLALILLRVITQI